MDWQSRMKPIFLAVSFTLLAACTTAPKTLYQWEGYQSRLWSHFKGESPAEQLEAMQQGLAGIERDKGVVPPGYYAHMALLAQEMGQLDQAKLYLGEEKRLFPESSSYINLLVEKKKK